MMRTRRFARQIFRLRKITIDRTQVTRRDDGLLLSETRRVVAVEVSPSPVKGLEHYHYVPLDPENAYAELAQHVRRMYGIGAHQLIVRG